MGRNRGLPVDRNMAEIPMLGAGHLKSTHETKANSGPQNAGAQKKAEIVCAISTFVPPSLKNSLGLVSVVPQTVTNSRDQDQRSDVIKRLGEKPV